jgi:hypothetical protein
MIATERTAIKIEMSLLIKERSSTNYGCTVLFTAPVSDNSSLRPCGFWQRLTGGIGRTPISLDLVESWRPDPAFAIARNYAPSADGFVAPGFFANRQIS